jgi:hypothetical protein
MTTSAPVTNYSAKPSVAGSYIGWVGYRNLGDEAMWMICRERFPRVNWSVQRERKGPSFREFVKNALRRQRTDEREYETAILGGGTIVNCGEVGLNLYRQARARVKKPVPVFGSGIYMPGTVSNIANWRDRRREWVELFSELPVVGVRGPDSKQLMEESGAKNVLVSGDPAAMFHRPIKEMESDLTLSSRGKGPGIPSGRLRIGINAGGMSGIEYGSVDDINSAFVRAAKAMLGQGHELEVFSIWDPDQQVCEQVARECAGQMRVHENPIVDPYEYLEFVQRYDLVIALKLHAGILAAAANVPAIFIEYQRKTHDFAASMGWEEYSVRGDRVGGLTELAMGAADRAEELRRELCVKMCGLKAKFEAYCDRIEPLVYG